MIQGGQRALWPEADVAGGAATYTPAAAPVRGAGAPQGVPLLPRGRAGASVRDDGAVLPREAGARGLERASRASSSWTSRRCVQRDQRAVAGGLRGSAPGRLPKERAHVKALREAGDTGGDPWIDRGCTQGRAGWRWLFACADGPPSLGGLLGVAGVAARCGAVAGEHGDDVSERHGFAGTADFGRSTTRAGSLRARLEEDPGGCTRRPGYRLRRTRTRLSRWASAKPGLAGAVVRLPKTTADSVEVRVVPAEEMPGLFETFLHVLEVWKWTEAAA